MILLFKKVLTSKIAVLLRNTLNIKPVSISKYKFKRWGYSVSDSFLYRTDKNYKTIFRFSDIPQKFFDLKNTEIELVFFDNKNNELKKMNLNQNKKLNEIIIDKNFLGNKEIYGHFNIFHKSKDKILEDTSFSNRCYIGFGKKNFFSFVHGNSYVKSKSFYNDVLISNFANKSLILNFEYNIQESFQQYDKVELFINNPTNNKIKILINNNNYILSGNEDFKHSFSGFNKIKIMSNCGALRPVVFTYKGDFFDVHHA